MITKVPLLGVENGTIFPAPAYELAVSYRDNMSSKFSVYQGAYIEETIYQGKKLLPCSEYRGKKVYNRSWYFGIDALQIGDYVDQDIADDIINCLPPACMKYGFVQLGEPSAHKTNQGPVRLLQSMLHSSKLRKVCGNIAANVSSVRKYRLHYKKGVYLCEEILFQSFCVIIQFR